MTSTTAPADPESSQSRPALGVDGREPALDGLRALCVVAVALYHLPVAWLPGGFLAVSTFFTLSGFLITRLVLAELTSTGRIRAVRFTMRRLRRLMPAAAVVALLSAAAWSATGRSIPSGDTSAALGYVSNWWHLGTGQGYGELFRSPSPFQHYWSLAIEEQFYLAFPLLALGLYRVSGRRLGGLAIGVAVATAGSFVLAATSSFDTAYYGTHTRAAEILVGSLLAVLLSSARVTHVVARVAAGPVGTVTGFLGVTALLVLWASTRLASSWLFPWGTLATAVASSVVVVECLHGRGVRRLLARRPAAALGRVSYGIYLIHWPLFLLTAPGALEVPEPVRTVVRLVSTVALATALAHLVEQPVRTGRRWPAGRLPVALAGLSAAAIVVAAVAAPPPADLIDGGEIAAARSRLLTMEPVAASTPSGAQESSADPSASGAPARRPAAGTPSGAGSGESAGPPLATAAPVVAGPLQRVLFVGDSTSWSLSLGVAEQLALDDVDVSAFPAVGCGIGGATPISYLSQPVTTSASCDEWFQQLPEVIRRFDPDVVVVVGGVADLSDREVPELGWTHIGNPPYDAWLTDRMHRTADLLTAGGARIVWATLPHLFVLPNPGFTGEPPFVENEPARAERYNELIESVAAADDRVSALDFAGFLSARPGGEFAPGLRPDGVHIDSRNFPDVAAFFVEAARLAATQTAV